MKKLSLLLILALTLISCNDDDGPSLTYDFARITGNNLPAFIEYDEDYDITATYRLKNACHDFYGFNVGANENEDEEQTLIINVVVITSYDPNITECTEEGALTETKSIFQNDFNLSRITSNEDRYDTIRFRFASGVNTVANEYEFTTVDVPIGEPEAEDPEETPAE